MYNQSPPNATVHRAIARTKRSDVGSKAHVASWQLARLQQVWAGTSHEERLEFIRSVGPGQVFDLVVAV